jgi:hypothetical protein
MQWSPFLGLNQAKQVGQWKTRFTLSLDIFDDTFFLQLGQVIIVVPTMPSQTGSTLFGLANARPAKPNTLTMLTAIQVVFRNSRRLLFINSPLNLLSSRSPGSLVEIGKL